jgi:hypothetical protein
MAATDELSLQTANIRSLLTMIIWLMDIQIADCTIVSVLLRVLTMDQPPDDNTSRIVAGQVKMIRVILWDLMQYVEHAARALRTWSIDNHLILNYTINLKVEAEQQGD